MAEELAAAGGELRVQRVRGWRRYAGTAADLLELNRLVLEALVSDCATQPGALGVHDGNGLRSGNGVHEGNGLSSGNGVHDGKGLRGGNGLRGDTASDADNRIEGCVELHPSACVQSSVIVGPVIVGPGALVQDSYIGPYTSIGAGVHIEGAEIEHSIILPRASITHIGGRLVGSVVGCDARVFRDFSLPRALRLNVGDGGEVALC